MTLDTDPQAASTPEEDCPIRLPGGLIGLPGATEFELVSTDTSQPIMWLRSLGTERLSLPVVEPGPLVADYSLELNDSDAEFLGIKSAEDDPLVLSVLTVKSMQPQKVTVNLVGPIVINRRTLIGKQVVLANFERYSVEHPLIEEKETTPPPC